jgi:MFS family permease
VTAKADASEASASGGDCHEGKVTWDSFIEAIQTIPGMLILAFVAFLGIGCIAPYVKLLAWDEFGLKETDFGLLILYPAPFIALAAVPLGHLADKFGKVLAVRFGFILCALGMWTLVGLYHYMILAANIPHHRELAVVIGGSLVGLGFVVAFPAWMALLTSICSEEKRGTVIGAVSTAQGLGVAVGLPIGGWLYKHYSVNPHIAHISPFFVSAILLAVSVVLSFILMKPAMEKHDTPAAA